MTDEAQPAAPINEAETAAIFAGPAFLANRFCITHGSIGCRLTFLEQAPGGSTYFRTSVGLGYPDLAALAQLLMGELMKIAAVAQAAAKPAPANVEADEGATLN